MLELGKNIVFLPQKYLRMTGDQIKDLIKGNFYFQKLNKEILIILYNFGKKNLKQ